ncbi:MAG: class I SAM-dependent methyltransferase [Candidatus Methanofastidiosa archaeon]|nr:class I SAM-dependent methyltransferase [Candidatus Methanofastidiosa archaeon]
MDEKAFLEEIQGSRIINSGMYEGIFKDFYHALHSQSDEFDLAFYSMECVPAKGNILELACGDGRISIPLIRKGCSFIGVDNSEDQLNELRSHLTEEENERVQLLNQDVLKLDIAEEIAVAIMPATSISLIGENIEKLEGLFHKIYEQLGEEGIFMFDYRLFVNDKPSCQRYKMMIKSEEHLVWYFERNDYASKMSILNVYIKPSQKDEYYHAISKKRLFMPNEIYVLAEKSGFKIQREDNRVYSDSVVSKYIVLKK